MDPSHFNNACLPIIQADATKKVEEQAKEKSVTMARIDKIKNDLFPSAVTYRYSSWLEVPEKMKNEDITLPFSIRITLNEAYAFSLLILVKNDKNKDGIEYRTVGIIYT